MLPFSRNFAPSQYETNNSLRADRRSSLFPLCRPLINAARARARSEIMGSDEARKGVARQPAGIYATRWRRVYSEERYIHAAAEGRAREVERLEKGECLWMRKGFAFLRGRLVWVGMRGSGRKWRSRCRFFCEGCKCVCVGGECKRDGGFGVMMLCDMFF